MARSGARDLGVGIVVLAALVLFGLGVLAISKESRMFVPKNAYWTRFDNTSGLVPGSPVRLVGVQIGTVDEITFPSELSEIRIKVTFKIDRAFAPRIRAGTVAYLKSLSYLSQDKYIELTPGDPGESVLPPGEYIASGRSTWETTLEQGQDIADDVKDITASLRDVLVAMNRGQGVIHDMIHNPEFGRQGVADLESSLGSLRRILERIDRGEGLAGAMLSDRAYARRQMENIDSVLAHMRSLLERFDQPDGLVAQLTDPQGKGRQILDRLDDSAEALSGVARKAGEGQGVVGRLMSDKEYADRLLKKVDEAAGHISSIMRKIDKGEGSIGGLVNDPEVYERLRDIVAGIDKSKVGKGMIRHYGKKGAKERSEAEEAAEEEPPPPDPGPTP
jgi:phospholipid/cholesterol/gamma-HCH transport system substrate-binding protein